VIATTFRTGLFAAGLLALTSTIGMAETAMTDAAKMTLYTYDKDSAGTSTCYDDCAKNWPPYLGKADEKMPEGWTLIERTDKTMQWAYDGKPTYLFAGDKKPGDMNGEGKGGVWHVLKE